MTTIQLHIGKLWFAAQASNWDLAEYELDELKETMEAAKGLNSEKNGVKVSGHSWFRQISRTAREKPPMKRSCWRRARVCRGLAPRESRLGKTH
jgi:hypothetical protein